MLQRIGRYGILERVDAGRHPAVIIDEEGVVLRLIPDLATVEGQLKALAGLV